MTVPLPRLKGDDGGRNVNSGMFRLPGVGGTNQPRRHIIGRACPLAVTNTKQMEPPHTPLTRNTGCSCGRAVT